MDTDTDTGTGTDKSSRVDRPGQGRGYRVRREGLERAISRRPTRAARSWETMSG
ncbi:hypothetical protein [Streptomyces sp. NRRL S-448]|uniref:hypothetical protein n=1 Tax=Streptomyces sp. NRRL S-448 TaxID=1463907 RepID=UPI000A930CC6